jgi:site-specific DNA-methyltransferase (adenine-specific)
MEKREPISQVTNEDCMELMSRYPDKYFELAIVDPPYGINFSTYERVGMGQKIKERYTKKERKNWDNEIPKDHYFSELFRVSKNQIIWGGNYFPYLWLNGCKTFIFWDKLSTIPNYSDGELAWTSFNFPAKKFTWAWHGWSNGILGRNKTEKTIHPTQKPIELYKWLLKNYASEGDKILDTHLGSGSSRIAADKMGYDFYACELDRDYFEAQEKRFKEYKSQLILF